LEEDDQVMGSTAACIQVNLQHSTAASRILTRTVGGKVIGTNTGAVVPGRLYQGLEHSRLYPVLCEWDRQTSSLYSYEERDSLDATRILL